MRTKPPTICEWNGCTAERAADAADDYDGWVWLVPSTKDPWDVAGLCPEHAEALEAMLKPVDGHRWTPLEEAK
jgi:hypothetical protein